MHFPEHSLSLTLAVAGKFSSPHQHCKLKKKLHFTCKIILLERVLNWYTLFTVDKDTSSKTLCVTDQKLEELDENLKTKNIKIKTNGFLKYLSQLCSDCYFMFILMTRIVRPNTPIRLMTTVYGKVLVNRKI